MFSISQVSFSRLVSPQEDRDFTRQSVTLPALSPRSLQEICRLAIRGHLRESVHGSHPVKLQFVCSSESQRVNERRYERQLGAVFVIDPEQRESDEEEAAAPEPEPEEPPAQRSDLTVRVQRGEEEMSTSSTVARPSQQADPSEGQLAADEEPGPSRRDDAAEQSEPSTEVAGPSARPQPREPAEDRPAPPPAPAPNEAEAPPEAPHRRIWAYVRNGRRFPFSMDFSRSANERLNDQPRLVDQNGWAGNRIHALRVVFADFEENIGQMFNIHIAEHEEEPPQDVRPGQPRRNLPAPLGLAQHDDEFVSLCGSQDSPRPAGGVQRPLRAAQTQQLPHLHAPAPVRGHFRRAGCVDGRCRSPYPKEAHQHRER